MHNATNESTNGITGNTKTEKNLSRNKTSGNNSEFNKVASTGVRSSTVTKKTIVEMCGLRMEKNIS